MWFLVRVKLGCSRTALTDSLYELSLPCVPDHRWAGWRECFCFFADQAETEVFGRVDTVRNALDAAWELVDYTEEVRDAPAPPALALAA